MAAPFPAGPTPLTPAEQFLKDLQDPFAAQVNGSSIYFALASSLGTLVIITLLFSILRPHNTLVYAPKLKYADKKHAPPPLGNGLFAWFTPVVKTEESVMVEKVGLDAVVFLRFTRMCRDMFMILTVVGCGILIPTHILTSDPHNTENLQGTPVGKAFALMTPQYVSGTPMWSHVACSWCFDIVVVYFLWRNYRVVARLRRDYFESADYQMSLASRSIWLTDIPAKEKSEEGILRIADKLEQTTSLPRAAIARNVKELPSLVAMHTEAVKKLESVLAKYLKNPDRLPATRPTMRPFKNDHRAEQKTKLDAIEYLTRRIAELEMEIKDVRESVDKRNPMPYGFATYETIAEAHTVAYAANGKHPGGVTVRLAPRPNDLIWENLPLTKQVRTRKRLMNVIWVMLLTVVWAVPNAMIAIFLVSLSNLAKLWPAFATTFDGHPQGWAVVQAIAAPGLISLIYLVLPIIFRRLAIRGGDMSKTARERHVTRGLYAFFVFNNLIVFSTFSAIWTFATSVKNAEENFHQSFWDAVSTGNLKYQIMITLCNISPFWINWLLQRNLGAAADLSQIFNMSCIWFARTFMAPTPRQLIFWTAPQPFEYASYYNYFLFYATVGLCYATLQPLVLPVTFFYFLADSYLKKYLLLYVFVTKTESGGQFWNILFNRILFATVLANCIAALVIMAALGSWTMVACMAPLPILILCFKIYCMQTYEKQCKYYNLAILKDPQPLTEAGKKARRQDRTAVKFGNPALYKPLITPMVHAKAQHVLKEIYRGRLNSVADGGNTGYSDIAMNPMSETETGKNAGMGMGGNTNDMFEVVPEANLDFAYFKNRDDFGDDHGNGGDLYGRGIDRSQTPVSFSTAYTDGPSSRSGSPFGARSASPFGLRPDKGVHPAYRGQGDLGVQRMYHQSNDSNRSLLGDPQAIGTQIPPLGFGHDGHTNTESYGMDRWRTAGTGYRGVPTAEHEEPLAYEAYRPAR